MPEKTNGRLGVELEAAEALAALAQHIISAGKGTTDSAEDDDSQGFSNRFKNTDESSTTPHDGLGVLGKDTNTTASMVMNSEMAEKEHPRMRHRVRGSGSCIKSRNHLTEAEREERRLRRVLANRESARQTIRRRQAIYELLTKNAAALAMENEVLKTEKEQALSKYSSLKCMNERFKDFREKAIQCGGLDLESSPVMQSTSLSSPTMPFPFFWPPFVNLSESSPIIASLETGLDKSNGMGTPVYVLPIPWFFPLQMPCILQSFPPSIQYLHHGDIQGISSQAKGDMENRHASSSLDGGFGVAKDIICKQSADTMEFEDAYYCTLPSGNPEDKNLVEMAAAASAKCVLAATSDMPITCSSKASASAAVAAEARRRRKELTKLKTLYCRKHRVR